MEHTQELILQARDGNREAFAELYGQIYKDLYRFAYYTLRNAHDAEDVVSETVVSAYKQIANLRQAEAFRGWFFKILSNQCKRKLKEYVNKTVEMPEQLEAEGTDFIEDIMVRSAFEKLSDEERLIISMHLFAGYSSQETGEILHMSANTVRSKESRALKKMKNIMEGGR
ncbi:MAG: RNA polymerase sigma factor [Lachnospiraceae bacterium]|nr:RNA polymerase sigma factor [Lachnospiraceae bacterium]MDD3614726.1 RNA polymerase sigma factor [Lachnospiraceae bacterium]